MPKSLDPQWVSINHQLPQPDKTIVLLYRYINEDDNELYFSSIGLFHRGEIIIQNNPITEVTNRYTLLSWSYPSDEE